MTKKDAEKLTEAFIESVAVDDVGHYLERGRRHERSTLAALQEAWADAFQAFMVRRDHSRQDDYLDVCAEYRLRGLPEPQASPEDMERITARVRNPEFVPSDGLRGEIERFLRRLAAPKN
jgi:hypothetical protein